MRYALRSGMTLTEYWDSTDRDLLNFVMAANERRSDEIEQGWDYARHIMWAVLQPNSKSEIKMSRIIRLKRDGPVIAEITPYQQQELDKWSEECDEDMPLVDWDGNPINK